jgi:hypothetical protein
MEQGYPPESTFAEAHNIHDTLMRTVKLERREVTD